MATKANHALTTPSGRPASFGQRVRDRIDSTMIVGKLQGHIRGEEEMSATQINAARILLNRTVPELKSLEVVQKSDDRDIKTISASDLLDVIEGSSKRVTNGTE